LVYHYTIDGRVEERERETICPIKGFGGPGRLEGYAPYHFHANSIGLSAAAEKYGAEFFEKGGRPSGVFAGDKWPTPDQASQFDEMFEKRSGKPLIIGGDRKYTPLTTPNNEAQFMELREFQVRETAKIWGVPPDMVGATGGDKYNNVEQRNIQFLQYTLRPYLVRIEQALNGCLLTRSEQRDYYLEFDVNGLLRGDSASRAAYYRDMRMISGITPNEIRERENLPKDPAGDDLHAPLNMAPLDQLRAINEKNDGDNNGNL
jgi:HK97 family phage portal protein